MSRDRYARECTNCHLHEHEVDALHCKRCGEKLPDEEADT
jgi:hypothetical protein